YLVGEIVSLDGELSEHLVTTEELRAHDTLLVAELEAQPKTPADVLKARDAALQRIEMSRIVDLLRAEKVLLGVLDFGDQLAEAVRLIREHPAVAEAERERYRVVLLDEYQDTSVAQKVMLTALFGGGHPVTAVGDPCQAIYGWRGASVGNIDAFPIDFARADGSPAQRYDLAQNNRSGGLLLRLANAVSELLRARHPGLLELAPRPGVEADGRTVAGLFERQLEEVEWVAESVLRQLSAPDVRPRDIAVLVRVRADFAPYHDALVARGIPVEVVGLGGLLALPEVADLVATLEVLVDATANTSLVRLLTGPRWRIGPRDLVLLGRRAADLVRAEQDRTTHDAADVPVQDVEELLDQAVAGVDPAEVVSLSEALEHPGPAAYSPEARERFARLASELSVLRRHVGDPLLDLLHRVLATTGLDVEVGAAPQAPRTRRSEALASFLDHAADFADLDEDSGVRAFLAFLAAADRFERGLDTAAPTSGDTVKLMTIHKAKGLEWPVVVVPDVTRGVFPSTRSRSSWTTSGSSLPTALRGDAGDFPPTPEWTVKGLAAHKAALRAIDELEERRLAYVALTRAKDTLVVTGHWWGPTQKKPRGPSPYLEEVHAHCVEGQGGRTFGDVVVWTPEPEAAENPWLAEAGGEGFSWPLPLDPAALAERRHARDLVLAALAAPPPLIDHAQMVPSRGPSELVDEELTAAWDRDAAALLEEARALHTPVHDVPVPAALSASALVRLAADPAGLARDLARPMPRPPAPAARRGTRFHAWVEGLFDAQPLLDRSDLEGAADDDLVDDADLASLQAAFLAGPYSATPPHRVEAPFQLVLGQRVVRGRIDAVYRRADGGFDVVDWKTGSATSDPLQLAVYRAAWAQIAGVAEDQVGAAFYYVARGEIVRHDHLPGVAELTDLVTLAS
ncbi:MAG TPA: ATP-dependent DNA helicase, partial [Candidatus Limnocylindria bacterium]|nr:ATP-dependent DNA helicase [Candidatus Limnocylindria bacterium]